MSLTTDAREEEEETMQIPSLQELLQAGVHFGHQVRRSHPKMHPFLYGARDGVHIIDLVQSEKGLREACEYLRNLGQGGGTLLLVGTKKQAQSVVQEVAQKIGASYLTERWIGGFLTNFEEIAKNIKKLKTLLEQKEKGEFQKFTKKEQLLLERKITKLEKDLRGVMDLESIPDAIFVVDAQKGYTALKEAQRVGVKVVAIVDSNADPSLVDFPIPGNDDAIKSIKIIVETAASAYGEGLKEVGKKKTKEGKKPKEVVEEKEVPEEVAEEVAEAEEETEKEVVEESERKG